MNPRHIHTVLITSGLGNQMFCYAFYQSLRKQLPRDYFLFDSDSHIHGHYGLEIFKVFHCRGLWRWYMFRLLKKTLPHFRDSFTTVKQNNALAFEPLQPDSINGNTYFVGFHQSEKYFIEISNKIRHHFRFKTRKISHQTKLLAKEISECNSVSIHIRRGDYLKQFPDDMCTLGYYLKSIEYFNQRISNPDYYVFSDDIEWCKDKLGRFDNYHYVDINSGTDSWQDMYLMTHCKHNIIANSSFSWWGAWLNNNKNKIVLAPTPWFRTWSDNSCFDAIPDSWIMIDNN